MGFTRLNNLKLYKFIKIKIMNSTFLVAIGVWQIVLIVLVVLLMFGGKKIPELMRGAGKGLKEFKDAKEDSNKEIEDKGRQLTPFITSDLKI